MTAGNAGGEPAMLEALMAVPLQLSAHVGSCRMTLSELLKTGIGSVIELDRLAGEPIDVLVNDRPMARGEIVAVGDRFAIRITEMLGRPV